MARNYTIKQINQAIFFWKKQLDRLDKTEQTVNENESQDSSDDDELETVDADTPSPFTSWDPNVRLARAHNATVKKVIALMNSKFLNKAGLGEDSISITNSVMSDDGHTGDFDSGNTMVVTLRVTVDEAHVKGFRKLMAMILKESTFSDLENESRRLNENVFDMISKAFGSAREAANISIDKANKEMELKIGLAALQEYFKIMCGKSVASKLKTIEPGIEKDDDGKSTAFIYKAAVKIK